MPALALLLTAAVALPGNAWTVWAAPDAALGSLEDKGVLPGESLQEDSRVPADALAAADANARVLEDAVARLERGLALSDCRRTDGTSVIEPLRLAKAAVARALLFDSRGEEGSSLALDLLTFGRRIARCGDGRLILFLVGHQVDETATTLARWSAHWDLWTPEQVRAFRQAVAKDRLTRRDLSQALDSELAGLLPNLPPATEDGPTYSQADTERLLRSGVADLAAATRPADFAALRERSEHWLDASEKALLEGMDVAGPQALAKMSLGSAARPNLAGRWVASVFFSSALIDRTEQVSDQLTAAEAAPWPAPTAGPRSRRSWIAREVEEVSQPTGQPPPAASQDGGSCSLVSSVRYRIDRKAEAILRGGLSAIASMARVVPHFQDGGVDGFKLLGIQPGSLAASCGFQSGDLLLSLNGQDIRDPPAALTAMDAVRRAGYAAFVLLRHGERIAFTVEGNR